MNVHKNTCLTLKGRDLVMALSDKIGLRREGEFRSLDGWNWRLPKLALLAWSKPNGQ
jgi:hypothetical protein